MFPWLKVPCAPKWFVFEFPIIKTTKPLVETRSGTWAKGIYSQRLIGNCRAPLRVNPGLTRVPSLVCVCCHQLSTRYFGAASVRTIGLFLCSIGSSDSRFGRKLSETTGHRLPQFASKTGVETTGLFLCSNAGDTSLQTGKSAWFCFCVLSSTVDERFRRSGGH